MDTITQDADGGTARGSKTGASVQTVDFGELVARGVQGVAVVSNDSGEITHIYVQECLSGDLQAAIVARLTARAEQLAGADR